MSFVVDDGVCIRLDISTMVSSAVAVLLLSQFHLPFIASRLHTIKLLIKSSHEKKRALHYTAAGTFQGNLSEEWWSTISVNSIRGHPSQFPSCRSVRQYPESLSLFTLRLFPFLLLASWITQAPRELNEFSLFRKWWWIFYVTNSCSVSWMRRSGSGAEMRGTSTSKSREPLMSLSHY